MAGVNVRRLAAIDMYGARGATRRRRIILAEFTAGVLIMVPFGVWLAAFSSGLAGRVLGLWMAGSGLNGWFCCATGCAARPHAAREEDQGMVSGG